MMPVWCSSLDPHLSTHHSNIGIQLRYVTKLGQLTFRELEKPSIQLSFD